MEIKGYKAFNKDYTNRYGIPFEEGENYHIDGLVKFGNFGNGFHMCTELSDVFRYFPNDDEDVAVAEVTGYGELFKYDDEYYGYYDMYVVSDIKIDKFLSREEIIAKIMESGEINIKKFLATFRLNDKEKMLFLEKFKDNRRLVDFILYFQFGIKDIFKRSENNNDVVRRILRYGQNNYKRGEGE